MTKTSQSRATGTAAAARPRPAAKPSTKDALPATKVKPARKAVRVKLDAVPAEPPVATKPAVKASVKAVAEQKEKAKKAKLVRDSFTMPEAEYAALGEVKKACLKAGVEVKKSELLRIGVAMVRQLDMSSLKEALAGLPTLKAGRPKKAK